MKINIPKIFKFKVLNLFNISLLLIAFMQYSLISPITEAKISILKLVVDIYLDYKIKFIPGFIIFYMSVYILILFVVVYLIRKKESFNLSVFLFSLVALWSLINFAHSYIYTMNGMRPEITNDAFFFAAVKSLYTSVKQFNGFPSWHAATAVLCAIALIKNNFRKPVYIYIWTALICISPLFIKMNYIVEVLAAIPLPFFCYSISERAMKYSSSKEIVHEITKAFSLESLIQSVAIGIRDENTLVSLIEGLTRIEKTLTEKDKEEIKQICSELHPPAESLKEIINNLIISIGAQAHIDKAREMFGKGDKTYFPTDEDLKHATDELIGNACRPFDSAKFRYILLEIRKRNTNIINTSSLEEAARERSQNIIHKFGSFLEAHRKDIPVIDSIINAGLNGYHHVSYDEIKLISKELRKPPYEITLDEVWNAYHRIDNLKVKPIGDQKNPANIISLTQYAMGKIDTLEPYAEKVDIKFDEWIKENEQKGIKFTAMEMDWLKMMKNHIASFLEISMLSFNNPPFINKGGASKAYNIFGQDLNRILYELNEKLK